MKRKARTADYFNFSRRERIGIISLCFLILITSILPHITPRSELLFTEIADTAWLIDSTPKTYFRKNQSGLSAVSEEVIAPTLFPFDPNTIGFEDWEKLGLRKKTILTILNYTSKGGKFRKPEDLSRMYGLREDEYLRLKPYIRISSSFPVSPVPEKKPFEKNYPSQKRIIDINTADTADFIALPGIGSKLASRIVLFRDKLGGFNSIAQIREVYGLHDSIFNKISSLLTHSPTALRTIDINTATFEVLSSHPYIRKEKAQLIINYRNEHGKFKTINDLKLIHGVKTEDLEKLRPYLIAE